MIFGVPALFVGGLAIIHGLISLVIALVPPLIVAVMAAGGLVPGRGHDG